MSKSDQEVAKSVLDPWHGCGQFDIGRAGPVGSCERPWRVSNPEEIAVYAACLARLGHEHRVMGCRLPLLSLPCDRNRRPRLVASIRFSLAFADFQLLSFPWLWIKKVRSRCHS